MHVDIIYLETIPPCNKTELSVQCTYFEIRLLHVYQESNVFALNIYLQSAENARRIIPNIRLK